MTFEQYLNEEEKPQFIEGATAGFIAALEWMKDKGLLTKDMEHLDFSEYIDIKNKKFVTEFDKQKEDVDRIVVDLLDNNDDVNDGLKKFYTKDKVYALHIIENGIKKDLTKQDYETLLKLSDLVIKELKGEVIDVNNPQMSTINTFPTSATYSSLEESTTEEIAKETIEQKFGKGTEQSLANMAVFNIIMKKPPIDTDWKEYARKNGSKFFTRAYGIRGFVEQFL